MAEFICSNCNHTQSVIDEYIGKNVKCPKCLSRGVVGHFAVATSVQPQPELMDNSPIILRASGGSIRTQLSRTIVLNKESTLEREFITVIDPGLPVGFTQCVGVYTAYEAETDYSSSRYIYSANYAVKVIDHVRAFEARFLTFDIWGRHVVTLSATVIADMPSGTVRPCQHNWDLYSESDACEYYASIAFIATVRTFNGQVYESDIEPVITEAKRFSAKFTNADIEPTARKS